MTAKKILRAIIISGIFIIPLIPFIVSSSLYFPFITGKNFTFRVVTEIIFAAWLVLAIVDTKYRPRWNALLYSLAAFIAVIFLADLFAVNGNKAIWSNYERMEGFVTLAHLFMYFLAASSMAHIEKLWIKFFYTTVGASIFMGFYGFLQQMGDFEIHQGSTRLDATLGNSAYLAIYTLFHIFFVGYLIVKRKHNGRGYIFWSFLGAFGAVILMYFGMFISASRGGISIGMGGRWLLSISVIGLVGLTYLLASTHNVTAKVKRWVEYGLYGVALLINSWLLYETQTRGTILGLAGGLLVTLALLAIFERKNKVVRYSSLGLIVFVIAISAGLYAAKDTSFVRGNETLRRLSSISLTETTTQSRFLIWNMALKGVKEKPVLGWGQEGFNYVFNKYYDPRMYSQEQWFDRAHNVFLDWAIAGGILGLLAYLSLYAMGVYMVWRKSNFTLMEKSLITGLFVGYFIHNFFVFDNLISYVFFFTLLTYIYSETGGSRVTSTETYPDRYQLALPIVGVALLIALYVVNVRPLNAARDLIQGITPHPTGGLGVNLEYFQKVFDANTFGSPEAREQLLQASLQALGSSQVDTATKTGFAKLVEDEMAVQLGATPNDARYFVLFGSFLGSVGNFDKAIEYLERAHELSPAKQTISFELISAYINKGQTADALALAKQAYESEPKFLEARIAYAITALYAKQEPLANELLALPPAIDVVKSDALLGAYIAAGNFKKVLAIWKERVARDPQNAQAHLSLAAAYLKTGDRTNAILELQKAKELSPEAGEQIQSYIDQIRAGKTPIN